MLKWTTGQVYRLGILVTSTGKKNNSGMTWCYHIHRINRCTEEHRCSVRGGSAFRTYRTNMLDSPEKELGRYSIDAQHKSMPTRKCSVLCIQDSDVNRIKQIIFQFLKQWYTPHSKKSSPFKNEHPWNSPRFLPAFFSVPRCHPLIGHLCGQLFYEGRHLRNGVTEEVPAVGFCKGSCASCLGSKKCSFQIGFVYPKFGGASIIRWGLFYIS